MPPVSLCGAGELTELAPQKASLCPLVTAEARVSLAEALPVSGVDFLLGQVEECGSISHPRTPTRMRRLLRVLTQLFLLLLALRRGEHPSVVCPLDL